MLKETRENRYTIVDENCDYVHEHSIKKVDKNTYIYNSYKILERKYTSDRIDEVMDILLLHNKLSGMNHTFKIIVVGK